MLQLGSAAAAAGLAGCAGDDPDGNGTGNGDDGNGTGNGNGNGDAPADLGERVPEPIVMEYWSNLGGVTSIMEAVAPIIQENLQETLDTNLEIAPVEFTTQVDNIITDKRTHHVSLWYHTSTPDRLDPQEMTRRFSIDWAGGNGRANPSHYASCEYSNYAVAQERAPDADTRREWVTEAHSIMSEDVGTIPLFPTVLPAASNPELVDLDGIGEAGIGSTNPYWYIKSEPVDGDRFVTNAEPTDIETTNFPVHDSSATVAIWSHLFHSTLTEYDEDWNLQPILAEDYEFEDDGRVITAYLREDMTFHNGDEITAEDVTFTFEHLWENPGSFPHGQSPPYTSIEALDEKTVEFTFEQPYPSLVTREWPRWGILHSESWIEGGAPEDPDGYMPDPVIGSGPFELVDFEFGQYMETEPHDGHPVHRPDHAITHEVYREESTAVEAFLAEELDAIGNLSPGSVDRIGDEMPGAEIVQSLGFVPYVLYPQHVEPPSTFRPFREAVGMCLDRELMVEVATRGESMPQLYSSPLMESHPFYAGEDRLTEMTDDPTGDIEGARQVLEDAGWGWDDDDNLRYPEDADLEGLWPEGSVPQPDDFECIVEENEFEPTIDL